MHTVEQGRIGESLVVAELVKRSYEVFLPAFGNAECDILAMQDGKVTRVEVKSTRTKSKSGRYLVQLKSVRPNKTANVTRAFEAARCDMLAVCVIPTGRVHLMQASLFDGRFSVTVDG